MKQYNVLIVFMLLIANTMVRSSPGVLDTTFGTDGVVLTHLSRTDYITGCTVQPDDTIVVTGSVSGYFQNMGVARYTDNGTLDTTFNSTGTKHFKFGTAALAQSLTLQPDNKILLTGYTSESITDLAIARLNTTGTFDTTFNGTGLVEAAIGDGTIGYSVVVQPDTKIVAGGLTFAGQGYFALTRYDTDGVIDSGFGDEGVVLTPINYVANINQIALQSDDKIIAAGYTYDFSFIPKFCLARYNSDGTLDTSFGNEGISQDEFTMQSVINSIAIQDDGYIVAAGYTLDTDGVIKFAIARYDTEGLLDKTFGNQGVTITAINYEAKANSIVIQADGKIIVGGYTYNDLATEFALARYDNEGIIDTSFGSNGIVTTTIGGHNSESRITSLTLQSTGDIIAAGFSNNSFAIARYLAD